VTIIADTCGFHHMLAGACSSFTNEKRDGVNNTKTCRDNPAAAPKPSGIAGKDVPVNMSVFMNARLAGTELVDPGGREQGRRRHRLSRRNGGNRRVFQLCPQTHTACNAFCPKPLRARPLRARCLLIR
jgi:uncharacterized protein YcgI (DUF1989 family)